MGLVDKWKAMWKDRHLCTLEELEKKLKTNKIVTTLQLIPTIILTPIMLYYFFMLSIIDDNNLKTLVYLKTINKPITECKHVFDDLQHNSKCKFCGKTLLEIKDKELNKK